MLRFDYYVVCLKHEYEICACDIISVGGDENKK